MGARVYQPALGRFLQVDSVPGGSANSYDYVNQDPLSDIDVGGLYPNGCFDTGKVEKSQNNLLYGDVHVWEDVCWCANGGDLKTSSRTVGHSCTVTPSENIGPVCGWNWVKYTILTQTKVHDKSGNWIRDVWHVEGEWNNGIPLPTMPAVRVSVQITVYGRKSYYTYSTGCSGVCSSGV